MTLLTHDTSPLDDVWVSLDLETTGLSSDNDEIIEVGAVKFQGQRTIDTFQTFVNPNRPLNGFVRRYTGITQKEVDGAPPFKEVARRLAVFIGAAPIVGHNVAFDLGFLASKGLRLPNPRSDTWDLAYVLLPESREYALARIAASLGIPHPRPHRAEEDAAVTRHLFLKLAGMAAELDVFTLAEMERLASRSSWVLAYLLRGLETHKGFTHSRPSLSPQAAAGASAKTAHADDRAGEATERSIGGWQVGVTGLDIQALRERLQHVRALRPSRVVKKVDVDQVAALLGDGGPMARAMPAFEQRPQQIAMARAVAEAINDGQRLMVEAGTGVGKSLGYLLPAALYALANSARVVVSTNTINLQEQLLTKDIPALVDALAGVDGVPAEELRFTQLKGRSNYLCLKRWMHLRSSDGLTDDEARLLSKALVWLRSTATGDRSELNLAHRNAAAPWDRLSAQGAQDCTGVSGVCFLRAARDKAASAHLVVVNHALLMSDLIAGRALIPDYDILIVDEAHHLEEEATRHLGFELAQGRFEDHLQMIGGERGLLNRAVAAFWGSSAADTRRETVQEASARITALLPSVRESVGGVFGLLGGFLEDGARGSATVRQESRVTPATRSQPAWSQLEVQWENLDVSLAELQSGLAALSTSLEGLDEAGLTGYEGLVMEAVNALQVNAELRERLAEFIPQPKADGIYWATRAPRRGDLVLHAAPLHVGEQLEKLLYGQKTAVILTSATLSANESFDHVRERTGFSDAEELLLGSPFDYPRAALLCVPQDMPEPSSSAYQTAVEQAIVESTVAAGGRTMALFTSHASLRAVAGELREDLEGRGFDVLAQGVDGPPHRLLERFLDNPRSVLLGTSSFWEGVDLAGEALQVLLLARLPFSVPTEPVFAARSELYEDSFNEYAVPQAVLRIRQGFGRLIRTKTDRGVVVILDRRILSRGYGKAFLRSLPDVTFRTPHLHELPHQIQGWLARSHR
jgi:DNA polymerase-3 subunit epsilon/ATP-dependent DNA helicase DinG